MGLPRTFVGFSSTDIGSYRLMQAWKAHENIDFNFTDCQLTQEIRSEDEGYIKGRCKERIGMAGHYILLIGEDTRYKHKYVTWEAEVAIEKKCTLIGVNLNNIRRMDAQRCPAILKDAGAIFVAFKAKIIARALTNFARESQGHWYYPDDVYRSLGLL